MLKETEGAQQGQTTSAPERVFRCARCEAEISKPKHLFGMRSASHTQVFPNPYGHMRVILTLKEARGLIYISEATSEFTWFAGYSWRVACCAGCQSHLGWLFEAVEDHSPRRFYGLLKEALSEG